MSFNKDSRFEHNDAIEKIQTPPPRIENTATYLNTENKNFFSKISEGAKNLANQAYEGLYKVPVVNRLVGKMEIAYNQFWIDRHQNKAASFKSKIDGLGIKIEAKENSEKEINSVVKELEAQGFSGVRLQLKIQELEKERVKLENKQDKKQSKFESKENKVKIYTEKRDKIAYKLIDRYEKKIEPMEKELEILQSLRDEADLKTAVIEIRYKEQMEKLKTKEEKKTKIEEGLRRGGLSEKEIKKTTKELEDVITEGYLTIKKGRLELAEEREKMNRKIAKVDAKANPYRDKREEFIRVKDRRPINMEIKTREKVQNVSYKEETSTHIRKEPSENTYPQSDPTTTKYSNSSPESFLDFEPIPETETEEAEKIQFEIPVYINNWNNYLKEKFGKEALDEFIDGNDFLKKTGFSKIKTLEFIDFKNILKKYYKVIKLPIDKINALDKKINDFFEKVKKII